MCIRVVPADHEYSSDDFYCCRFFPDFFSIQYKKYFLTALYLQPSRSDV